MLIANKYEIPDTCPKDCIFKNDILCYGQNAMCIRCPILNCKEPVTEKDKDYMPLLRAEDFREDWAEEWNKFFKNETDYPILFLDRQ